MEKCNHLYKYINTHSERRGFTSTYVDRLFCMRCGEQKINIVKINDGKVIKE